MSHDPPATYVRDHLAGAAGALDMVEALRDRHAGEPRAGFAATLHARIAEDRATLEALALGIWGKRALWRALGSVADTDARLQGYDFAALARGAEGQHDDVESQRLALAAAALAGVAV
jgi:hypothetical protein